jgi:hypothetical protein
MKPSIVFIALLLCLLVSPASSQVTVNGEVFIVTRGGNNFKLGLVTVAFFTPEQYEEALNCDYYKNAFNAYIVEDSISSYKRNLIWYAYHIKEASTDSAMGDTAGYASHKSFAESTLRDATVYTRPTSNTELARKALNYYAVMKDVITDKTNSDGKFSVRLKKKQQYVVYANANRAVMDGTEEYHWSFKYIPDGKPLFLSNDNMSHN